MPGPRAISRRGFLGASTLGATALLAACGRSATDQPAAPQGQGQAGAEPAGTLVVWPTFPDEVQEQWWRTNIEQAFQQANPKVELSVSVKNVETIDRLVQTALSARRGPDVVPTPGPSYAASYVDSGGLAPLDDDAARYGWKDKLLPWAYDSGRLNGKLYSLPTSYESMVAFYNPATFDAKGWKLPTNLAETEALLSEAKGQGMLPVAAGNAEWKAATEWHVTVFLNHGAGPDNVYKALSGELRWTDPVFVDAMTRLNNWFQQGWMGGGTQRYFTNRFDTLYTDLAKGRAALQITGTWGFQEIGPFFKDATWDWAPIPALGAGAPAKVFALGIGGTMSVNAPSKAAPAAAAYLDWLISDPKRIAKGIADAGVQPYPVPLSEADFPAGTDQRQTRLYKELGEVSAKGDVGYTTWTFWPPKSNTYLYEEFEKVIIGRKTPADYLAGLDEVFAKERSEGKVPPLISRG
jgi:raffinose/stachyose/melibiose transport system substrate-binding protein